MNSGQIKICDSFDLNLCYSDTLFIYNYCNYIQNKYMYRIAINSIRKKFLSINEQNLKKYIHS